jgi:hypothetical protein
VPRQSSRGELRFQADREPKQPSSTFPSPLGAARAAHFRAQTRRTPTLAARRPVPTGATEAARRGRPAPSNQRNRALGEPRGLLHPLPTDPHLAGFWP